MKLPRHAFQTYWDVHAWSGALAAVVLSTMFFAGAFALFHEEIAAWQDPRAQHAPGATCEGAAIDPIIASAIERVPFAPRMVRASLHEDGCAPITIELRGATAAERSVAIADARTGRVLDERSNVSTFLFYFHFLYHPDFPIGIYVAGLLAFVLLLALVSGVLIHLKDLTRQLHRFRDDAHGVRVLFSDLHKVLGVMGLPFQVMVALTGAIIALAAPIAQTWARPVFDGDPQGALRAFFDIERAPPPSGEAGASRSLDELVERARDALPALHPDLVRVDHPGDAGASIELSGPVEGVLFGVGRVRVRASDGEVLRVSVLADARATHVLMRWVYGLHYARYGGVITRLLYALLGLAGCATLLTGNWIWLARRDRTRAHRGNRLLARLTIGGGLGTALAVAAMFLANRVVPIATSWHLDAEVSAFVLAWAVAMIASFVVRDEARCGIVILASAGIVFVLVPVLSVLVAPMNVLTAPGSDAAIVDIGLALWGALLIGIAALARARAKKLAAAEISTRS